MGDTKLSTTKATYYPPALLPGYMGQFLPVKHGYGSLAEKGSTNYYQDKRNETVSMPSQDWGLQSTPYSPRPDLVATNKIINMERMLRTPAMPMSQIDATRRNEIDAFYMAAQRHRDQYMDHTGRLHPLDYFKESEYRWQCPPDLTRTYLRYPLYYTQYKHPATLALTLGRTTVFPSLPDRSLAARYDRASDLSYKR